MRPTVTIISHKKHVSGAAPDQFGIEGGFHAIISELARHFSTVLLCVPVVAGGRGDLRYPENVQVVPLPSCATRVEILKKLPSIVATISRTIKKTDLTYVMGQDDVGLIGITIARVMRRRLFCYFGTDRAAMIKTRNYGAVIGRTKYWYSRYFVYPYLSVLCGSLPVFFSGNVFFGHYPGWTAIVSTTHKKSEMVGYAPRAIDKNEVRVTFAGRHSPEKNIFMLIDAVERLRGKINIRLNIVGDGVLTTALKEYVTARGLSDCVEMLGRIENRLLLQSNFMDADIFVLPSSEERGAKVIVEAMSRSIPVIASRVGGIPDIIEDGKNGLLFDPSSVQQLVQSIERIVDDPSLRDALAEGGYDFAAEHSVDAELGRLTQMTFEHFGLSAS